MAREAAIQNYPDVSFDFTVHDLKAKGISDLEGTLQEKQTISGIKALLRQPDMTEKFRLYRSSAAQKTEQNKGINSES